MADLTAEQEKALIAVVTAYWRGWCDAWDRGLNDRERELAEACFLAGVKWAEERNR